MLIFLPKLYKTILKTKKTIDDAEQFDLLDGEITNELVKNTYDESSKYDKSVSVRTTRIRGAFQKNDESISIFYVNQTVLVRSTGIMELDQLVDINTKYDYLLQDVKKNCLDLDYISKNIDIESYLYNGEYRSGELRFNFDSREQIISKNLSEPVNEFLIDRTFSIMEYVNKEVKK